jgi:peptide/nickel transport system permease protein
MDQIHEKNQARIIQTETHGAIGKLWENWRGRPIGIIGVFMVVVVLFLALFAPVIDRYDQNDANYKVRLEAPGMDHWMGTDELGRDIWSRIVHGARLSVTVAFISVFFGTGAGLILGVASGYLGGMVDRLIQRIVEIMIAMPAILLALALMATLGAGVDKVIIALSILNPWFTARIIRASVLSIKQNAYIDAAQVIGVPTITIMLRHIVPNVMPVYLIIVSSLLGTVILVESSLSYLGLGVPPPHPSWGRMLSGAAENYAVTAPWMVLIPGLAITWLTVGFNLFGDTLRDIWDPRLRGG